jgi:hypothetical protein
MRLMSDATKLRLDIVRRLQQPEAVAFGAAPPRSRGKASAAEDCERTREQAAAITTRDKLTTALPLNCCDHRFASRMVEALRSRPGTCRAFSFFNRCVPIFLFVKRITPRHGEAATTMRGAVPPRHFVMPKRRRDFILRRTPTQEASEQVAGE